MIVCVVLVTGQRSHGVGVFSGPAWRQTDVQLS